MSLYYAEKLAHAFVTSNLDYYNALLSGCPCRWMNILHLVQSPNQNQKVKPNHLYLIHIALAPSQNLYWF